jgi:two-component system cell cycle response regulator
MTVRIGFVGGQALFDAVAPLAPAGSVIERLSISDAKAAIEDQRLTLIVLDCGGEWREALERFRGLHAVAKLRPVATLALVPSEDPGALVTAFEMGVADCAALPLNGHEVRARIAAIIRRRQVAAKREAEVRAVRRMAIIDTVTGLYNRGYLDATLPVAIEQARRDGKPLAMLMLDLDRLKPFNDRWGHAAGDRVLRAIAEQLQKQVRTSDTVARFGGDEIAVVMPDTDLATARAIACRLKEVVAATQIGRGTDGPAGVTVSVGIATLLDADDSAQALLVRADQALYAAKRAGRNRVAEAA